MPISNPNPITIPETYAQTFDQFFLTKIDFEIKNSEEAYGYIVLKPYDNINEETLDKPILIQIPELWKVAEEVPEIKIAMDAVQSGVEAYQIYLENKIREAQMLAENQAELGAFDSYPSNPIVFLPND